ncbi:aspartate--tRNA(Asn) ligase [Conexivisphaera calida]|uniref:Aspartate--tRNA(Asp/Asn) ligase n=1 Tax=Conexivisphaera calida TaxID=1874277 RepID=A0A4V0P1I9_9ARCH|nr:aspartate--tRNA(Asn) ligase [Conexivisphaera calida]BBE41880.1 Aspartyl-tRNA synthetase [Conexivisphaera calida]
MLRTHRTSELGRVREGRRVKVAGWVSSVRDQGSITFLMLRDGWGEVQVTAKKGEVPDELLERLHAIPPHSSVVIVGTVRIDQRAPGGVEVIPSSVQLVSRAKKQPPFSVYGGNLPALDRRLDIRAVDLRRVKAGAIFRVRHATLRALRDFFTSRGLTEVQTPKIIATATEGGAELFPVLYFDREAFLAQSPQLYKEQLTMAFDGVFEIGPIFRAEPSRTLRHLSEAISVDVEMAFADYRDVMRLLEDMVVRVTKRLTSEIPEEFAALEHSPEVPSKPIQRFTYEQCLSMLREAGVEKDFGEDLETDDLRELGRMIGGYYFITDWPTKLKPFYIKPKARRPEVSESFDLMHGDLELSSGGSRIHRRSVLTRRLKEKGLKPRDFEYHLRVFDYGMPPHAGFGLGLDRFVMVLTGQDNIREVVAYPRDMRRLTP